MLRMLRVTISVFLLAAVVAFVLYSPFYSQWVIRALNHFVPVEVNQVAANSQKQASLMPSETLEPGSQLWIARQAYLSLLKQHLDAYKAQDLALIYSRYQELRKIIIEQQSLKKQNSSTVYVPLMLPMEAVLPSDQADIGALMQFNSPHNQELTKEYLHFLRSYPVEQIQPHLGEEFFQDLAVVQQQNNLSQVNDLQPYAIVVLGGGLTLADNGKDIIVNDYTRLRLETTLAVAQQYAVPILLSGVEAPYMQKWLAERGLAAALLEKRSMNTCENSRFSSLLLQKKGGAPRVILITDRYHMPRTRRLFALNGIHTLAVEAPMPTQLSRWQPSLENYDHSRRANYELLAILRDILFGSSDCREIP